MAQYEYFYGCPVQAASEELRRALLEALPEEKAARIMDLLDRWVEVKLTAMQERITGSADGWYE